MTFMCDICGSDLYDGQSYTVSFVGAGEPVREHDLCNTIYRGQRDLYVSHRSLCHKKGCEMYPEPIKVRQ